MARPTTEERIERKSSRSFDQLLEQIIREQRPSPEQLAAQLGCTVRTLKEIIKYRPVRIGQCVEWTDFE